LKNVFANRAADNRTKADVIVKSRHLERNRLVTDHSNSYLQKCFARQKMLRVRLVRIANLFPAIFFNRAYSKIFIRPNALVMVLRVVGAVRSVGSGEIMIKPANN
jgi:hypothetical protein